MTEQTETSRLLRPREAADMLAIRERTLWRLISSNLIACIRIGGAVRFDTADLAAYVDRQRKSCKSTG